MLHIPDLEMIRSLLAGSRRIAVVGLSPKPQRPSNQVAAYLLRTGFEVIPVNPGHDRILNLPCYPDLYRVPGRVDIVDIFRRADQVLPVVEAAIAIGAGAVWLQEGVVNEQAADLAVKAGLAVVMDRCIKTDHRNLLAGTAEN